MKPRDSNPITRIVKWGFNLLLFMSGLSARAQQPLVIAPDTLTIVAQTGSPVSLRKITGSEDATGFVLDITGPVKLHKHESHSEHVWIVKGRGEMQLGEKTLVVKKGDLIFIPRNTPHSVHPLTRTLRVVSIQAPQFDGKDRVVLE